MTIEEIPRYQELESTPKLVTESPTERSKVEEEMAAVNESPRSDGEPVSAREEEVLMMK